uniref:(northern house mosquito) hypothetical protein n=1 Tax=Culex pipiens TaxID=7175 RepID=A0A8D8F2N6_CULPI
MAEVWRQGQRNRQSGREPGQAREIRRNKRGPAGQPGRGRLDGTDRTTDAADLRDPYTVSETQQRTVQKRRKLCGTALAIPSTTTGSRRTAADVGKKQPSAKRLRATASQPA